MFLAWTNLITLGLAERPVLPWRYPYREDASSTRLGLPVYRPIVPVSVIGSSGASPIYDGLIDTGADAVLASDLVADYIGMDLEEHEGETSHAVAGSVVTARYKRVSLRLHPPDGDPDVFHEWATVVGFISGWHNPSLLLLGSIGFLDRWTVTVSRFSQAVVVEDVDALDHRFGFVLPSQGKSSPGFNV